MFKLAPPLAFASLCELRVLSYFSLAWLSSECNWEARSWWRCPQLSWCITTEQRRPVSSSQSRIGDVCLAILLQQCVLLPSPDFRGLICVVPELEKRLARSCADGDALT